MITLNNYLKDTFGEKVYKLSVNINCTCPNRDGTLDTRGCIFCHSGSSHFAEFGSNIDEQLDRAKLRLKDKTDAKKFIAYFGSYTNTYAPIEYLRAVFTAAIIRDDIVAVSIGTRPDCLSSDVLDLLTELNQIKPIWIELGLQTSKPSSVEYIRRCYDNSVFENAVYELKKRGITVITHIIIGLPNETVDDMTDSVDFAVKCGTDGIKLQLLHILEGTDLFSDYQKGIVKVLELDEYVNILVECIRHIPKQVVIHRLTGDAPKQYLAAPLWSGDKKRVLNTINKRLREEGLL